LVNWSIDLVVILMLKINRKLSHKGFSLIELMVAAAILAIALLGIFQAYSVGFMGMADSRDRTVATNYLREMIEDFKNMDFNKVKDEPITLIPGTKFHRGAIVLDLEKKDSVTNLKKVVTQVRWIDRKGEIKTEEASTILYNTPNTSEVSNAAGIILYATPYYTILPTHEVELTAEIKDENGNIITDWEGDVTFSIITNPPNDPSVGDITTPQPVEANNGVATCTFLAIEGDTVEGIEKIQASAILDVVGEVTDTVNIRVSTGAVGIILKPDVGHEILPVGDSATINITVVIADYTTTIDYSGNITLSAEGLGTLSTTTINEVPSTGAMVTLTSTGTPGVVGITASAPALDMGYTEVTFTGEPESILVSSEKNSIYPGEETTITVTIVDINNTPVGFDEIVTLNIPSDYGIFDDNSNSIDLSFTGESSLTSIFKASLTSPLGNVTISAIGGGLTGSTNIEILNPLVPHHIGLFAFPSSVDVFGGETSTTITATIYADNNEKITNYDKIITFIAKDDDGIVFGTFSEYNIIPDGGEATVELSSSSIGVATITVSSPDNLPLVPDGGITVVFYGSADHIVLSANPLSVQANGIDSSMIKAKVVDISGNIVTNYNSVKTITFIAKDDSGSDFGNFSENNIIPDEGVATVELSSDEIGTAIINANSSDGLSDNGSLSIEFTGEIPTELALGEVIYWDDYYVSFGITITGSSLNLYEMRIVWNNDDATLDEIKISSPYPGDESELTIDTTGTYSACTTSDIDKTLVIGESNIRLTFSGSIMANKNITVTFINEILESFEVTFIVPN
jgi:prepilin-type N-terminal cleavage/methylation domain-containing protein